MKHKNGRLTAESAAAMAGEQSLVDVLDEDLHPLCPNSNLFYGSFSITILSKDNTLHYGNDMCKCEQTHKDLPRMKDFGLVKISYFSNTLFA